MVETGAVAAWKILRPERDCVGRGAKVSLASVSSCSSSEVLFRLPPLVLPRTVLVPRGLPPRFLPLARALPPLGGV